MSQLEVINVRTQRFSAQYKVTPTTRGPLSSAFGLGFPSIGNAHVPDDDALSLRRKPAILAFDTLRCLFRRRTWCCSKLLRFRSVVSVSYLLQLCRAKPILLYDPSTEMNS